jgi:hypothetical protein
LFSFSCLVSCLHISLYRSFCYLKHSFVSVPQFCAPHPVVAASPALISKLRTQSTAFWAAIWVFFIEKTCMTVVHWGRVKFICRFWDSDVNFLHAESLGDHASCCRNESISCNHAMGVCLTFYW